LLSALSGQRNRWWPGVVALGPGSQSEEAPEE
jgi:hypothetical protein